MVFNGCNQPVDKLNQQPRCININGTQLVERFAHMQDLLSPIGYNPLLMDILRVSLRVSLRVDGIIPRMRLGQGVLRSVIDCEVSKARLNAEGLISQ